MTMSIVFAGTPANAAQTLRELHAAGIPIALVITRPDAEVGRKRVLTASSVAEAALELGLPLLKANRIEENEIEAITASGASLGVVVAYGALLKQPALDTLELGWYNLHYSLLPKWRGAAPVQHSLLNRDDVTGVSLFKIDSGLDTGEIVGQVAVPIEITDNAASLLQRLTGLGVSLLLQELPKLFAGVAKHTPQPSDGISLAPKPNREDARLLEIDGPKVFEAKVRAFNPEPGAWLILNGLPFKVLEVSPINGLTLPAFTASQIGQGIYLGLNGGAVQLIEVQPAGKIRMSAVDWFRGTTEQTRSFE